MKQHLITSIYRLFILLFVVLSLAGCETPSKMVVSDIDTSLPDEDSKGVNLRIYTEDKLEYHLQARHIVRYYDKQKTIGDSVYVFSIDQDTGEQFSLKCDTTIINDKDNIITSKGNVLLQYGAYRKLKTELAVWNRTTGKITCPGKIDFWDKETYLQGYNLVTNQALELSILEKVTGKGIADEKIFGDIDKHN